MRQIKYRLIAARNSRASLVEANAVTKSVASFIEAATVIHEVSSMVRYRGFTVADQVTTHELIVLLEDCREYLVKYGTDDWRDLIEGVATMLQIHCL